MQKGLKLDASFQYAFKAFLTTMGCFLLFWLTLKYRIEKYIFRDRKFIKIPDTKFVGSSLYPKRSEVYEHEGDSMPL